MSAIKWVLICALLNTAALIVVVALAALTNMTEAQTLSIGALFVAASAVPFAKARKAFDKEISAVTHPGA